VLRASGLTRVRQYCRFLHSLHQHLNQTTYDIVHAMLPVHSCDVYHPHAGIAADAAEAVGRPLAQRVANRLNRRRQMFGRVERSLLTGDRPPIVLCLSQYVKGFVRRRYDLPESELATLFNATDLVRFDPALRLQTRAEMRNLYGIGPDKVVALSIAQDFARKGLAEAIAGLAALNDPRMVLLVVGKQEPGRYRELARRAGISERVVFAGPTTDPYAFYKAADFFLLPTRHDPCSLVVLEALAMGVPVISTVFNGACEIMQDGVHGFVLPDPSDVQRLAEAMRQMRSEETRARMSAACRGLRPVLAYEHHLEELMRIYQRRVSAPSPSGRGLG
jgi:UDP-glucose:(heptosyl)LPS alpha-1,3-glucosyltransferase